MPSKWECFRCDGRGIIVLPTRGAPSCSTLQTIPCPACHGKVSTARKLDMNTWRRRDDTCPEYARNRRHDPTRKS